MSAPPSFDVVVTLLSGKKATVKGVNANSSVAAVKLFASDVEHVSPSSLVLMYGGHMLSNNGPLSMYRIGKDARLTQVPWKPGFPSPACIFLGTSVGLRAFTVTKDAEDLSGFTVASVKVWVQKELKIPIERQRLSNVDGVVLADNEKTLADYKVVEDDELLLEDVEK